MLDEKSLGYELHKQLQSNDKLGITRGLSFFAQHYVFTYLRLLPNTVLFDDVREKVEASYRDVVFLGTADAKLPWAALHVFFEHMFLPRLSDGNSSRKDIRKLLHVPETPAPLEAMRNPTATQIYFSDSFFSRLQAVEEDQLIGVMEDLFQASDRGFGEMLSRQRENFISLLRMTQFLFKTVYESRPAKVTGTFLAIVHAGYFPHIDGDIVLRHLEEAVVLK